MAGSSFLRALWCKLVSAAYASVYGREFSSGHRRDDEEATAIPPWAELVLRTQATRTHVLKAMMVVFLLAVACFAYVKVCEDFWYACPWREESPSAVRNFTNPDAPPGGANAGAAREEPPPDPVVCPETKQYYPYWISDALTCHKVGGLDTKACVTECARVENQTATGGNESSSAAAADWIYPPTCTYICADIPAATSSPSCGSGDDDDKSTGHHHCVCLGKGAYMYIYTCESPHASGPFPPRK